MNCLTSPKQWIIACAAAVACASCQTLHSTGFDISVRTSTGFLEDGSMFELLFLRTPGPIKLDGLMVSMEAPGEIEHVLGFELARDGNKNGMIDSGDALLVVAQLEETEELVEQAASLNIIVLVPFEHAHKQVWTGTWKPSRN